MISTGSFNKKIASLFKMIITGELNNEKYRSLLAEFENFNPVQICIRIDRSNSQMLTAKDINHFLEENSIYLKLHYISSFIAFYSGMKNCITYKDFNKFLYSKLGSHFHNEAIIEKKANDVSYIDYDIEQSVANLIFNEILLIEGISKHLDSFFKDPNFLIYSIIQSMSKSTDYIDEHEYIFFLKNSIERFLYEQNEELSDDELKLLLFRLDRDEDLKISYDELKFLFRSHVSAPEQKNNKTVSTLKLLDSADQKIARDDINREHTSKVKYLQLTNANRKRRVEKKTPQKKMINLLSYIEEVSKYEAQLESQRQKLSQAEDIIPIELFFLFDEDCKHSITRVNFKQILNKFRLFPSQEEIELIFHRYDIDKDHHLDYDEFSAIFAPYSNKHKTQMLNKLPSNGNESISSTSREILFNFLQQLINGEKKLEGYRKQLCSQEEFSAYEQFTFIKLSNSDKADKKSFWEYFSQTVMDYDEFQVDLVYKRFDKDNDGKISYVDFVAEITPLSMI